MKTFTGQLKMLAMLAGTFLLMGSAAFAQSVSIVGPTVNCQGSSLTLTVDINGLTGPYTYSWNTGETTSTVIVNSSALRRVTVTGTAANGQTKSVKSQPRLFLFFPSPTPSIASNGSTNLCDNPSVDLTANASGFFKSYQWSTGSTSQTISVTMPGLYAVTVTNQFGCSGQSEQLVNAVPTQVPAVTAQGPLTFCKPGAVTLDGDAGTNSYLWSSGESTQSINVALTGSGGPMLDTMSVSYLYKAGEMCEARSEVVVVRSIRSPQLENAFCPNMNLALTDSIKVQRVLPYDGVPASYEFEFEDANNPGSPATVVSGTRWARLSDVQPALQVGSFYNVRTRAVIDGQAMCYGSVCQIGIASAAPPAGNNTMRIVIDESGEAIQVREGLNFGVNPNPSNDVFTVSMFTNRLEMIQATVYDLAGRTISGYQIDPSEDQFVFGADLIPGIYMIEFKQGAALTQTVKIIKTN